MRRIVAVVLAGLLSQGVGLSHAVAQDARPRPGGQDAAGARSSGGNILLDAPRRAGGLTLFPVVGEPNTFRYAPMSPRLARDAQGRPQFSFLRFVENVSGAPGQDAAEEGEGGGIVHAVVTLEVPPRQVERAQSELEGQVPGAKIAGPLIYESGNFALVSSVDTGKDPNKKDAPKFSHEIVGMGTAPVLEGGKAAVSILLTKLGAKVLWESFHQATPDISFLFEMKLAGLRAPAKARIVAELDRVYENERIQAAGATPIFEFELKKAVEELAERKVLRVELIGGTGDPDFKHYVDKAEEAIRNDLFEKAVPGSGGSGGGAEGSQRPGGAKSFMDRALDIQKQNRAERENDAKAENASRNVRRLEAEHADAESAATRLEAEWRRADERARRLEAEAMLPPAGGAQNPQQSDRPRPAETPQTRPGGVGTQQQQPQQQQQQQQQQAQQQQGQPPRPAPAPPPGGVANTGTQPPQPSQQAQQGGPSNSGAQQQAPPPPAPAHAPRAAGEPTEREAKANEARAARRDADAKKTEADAARRKADSAKTALDTARTSADATSATAAAGEEQIEFAGFASYELKKVRRTGRWEYSLDKYTNGEITSRFDENIGDLTAYLDDPQFFRQVNLDDPFFKQRELVVYVDGSSSDDFAKFINFVTVQMRKQHGNGDTSFDEVRIDRTNFNSEGNRFRLLYGWKDDADSDRERWRGYEWRALWSFFGGAAIEQPWQSSSASGIPAVPPLQRRTVLLEGDPVAIKDARARSITVRIYYDLAGTERVEQVTLNADRGEVSSRLPIMLPPGVYEYDYDISWRLRGNRVVAIPRARTSESILYVDELPEDPAGSETAAASP